MPASRSFTFARAFLSNAMVLCIAGITLGCASDAPDREPTPSGRIAYLAQTNGYWQVWTLAPDGTAREQVTTSKYEKVKVSWHPDGDRVLVSSLAGGLFIVDIETGEETRVPLSISVVSDAIVSPDGDRIAFSANPGDVKDGQEIFAAGLDGSGVTRLTRMAGLKQQPAWSPDGQTLYFVSGPGGQDNDLWSLSVETGSRTQLTVDERYHFEPDVAADGTLAFSSNREGDYDIWTWKLSERPVRVTHAASLDGGPSWSPDGAVVVFHSTRSGVVNLWMISKEGGEATQLTDYEEGARAPDWWGRP